MGFGVRVKVKFFQVYTDFLNNFQYTSRVYEYY